MSGKRHGGVTESKADPVSVPKSKAGRAFDGRAIDGACVDTGVHKAGLFGKVAKLGEDGSADKFKHVWRISKSNHVRGPRAGWDIDYSAFASKISGFLDPEATIEQRKMDNTTMRSKYLPGLTTLHQVKPGTLEEADFARHMLRDDRIGLENRRRFARFLATQVAIGNVDLHLGNVGFVIDTEGRITFKAFDFDWSFNYWMPTGDEVDRPGYIEPTTTPFERPRFRKHQKPANWLDGMSHFDCGGLSYGGNIGIHRVKGGLYYDEHGRSRLQYRLRGSAVVNQILDKMADPCEAHVHRQEQYKTWVAAISMPDALLEKMRAEDLPPGGRDPFHLVRAAKVQRDRLRISLMSSANFRKYLSENLSEPVTHLKVLMATQNARFSKRAAHMALTDDEAEQALESSAKIASEYASMPFLPEVIPASVNIKDVDGTLQMLSGLMGLDYLQKLEDIPRVIVFLKKASGFLKAKLEAPLSLEQYDQLKQTASSLWSLQKKMRCPSGPRKSAVRAKIKDVVYHECEEIETFIRAGIAGRFEGNESVVSYIQRLKHLENRFPAEPRVMQCLMSVYNQLSDFKSVCPEASKPGVVQILNCITTDLSSTYFEHLSGLFYPGITDDESERAAFNQLFLLADQINKHPHALLCLDKLLGYITDPTRPYSVFIRERIIELYKTAAKNLVFIPTREFWEYLKAQDGYFASHEFLELMMSKPKASFAQKMPYYDVFFKTVPLIHMGDWLRMIVSEVKQAFVSDEAADIAASTAFMRRYYGHFSAFLLAQSMGDKCSMMMPRIAALAEELTFDTKDELYFRIRLYNLLKQTQGQRHDGDHYEYPDNALLMLEALYKPGSSTAAVMAVIERQSSALKPSFIHRLSKRSDTTQRAYDAILRLLAEYKEEQRQASSQTVDDRPPEGSGGYFDGVTPVWAHERTAGAPAGPSPDSYL